jgi:hypothetical protein
MKNIYLLVMLIVIALFMMGFIGGTASASGVSHAINTNHSSTGILSSQYLAPGGLPGPGGFSVDNCLAALYLHQEGLANFSYVSRARDLVDQNENRTTILDYIVGNPGLTQNDMIKALGMNIGTLRYHLMILALNHRVIPYNDGPRLVRYFVNKGAYSQDQMMVISLLKRDPTSRLLGAMTRKPAMTGSQISVDSGLAYSDINRYLKELTAKGVVLKESTGTDRYQYRIAPAYEEFIAGSLRK